MLDVRRDLIATKLIVPSRMSHSVPRPRLERMLTDALRCPLTVVVAPAGCGKTVLASRWAEEIARRGATVRWLSLDAKDDDPSRFWTYVHAALDLSPSTFTWAEDVRSEDPEDFLVPLSNLLAALETELVLVLDDVHVLTDPRILQGLSFLLDRPSPMFHVVALSRTEPAFLTPRRRATGDVVEVQVRDLAFDRAETAHFLSSHRIELGEGPREVLFQRCGGWAAALRLAILFLGGQADPDEAVASLTSTDSTLSDFLTTEVLAQLPDDLRQFLLVTSILPRLSGPLCDAVTGRADGAEQLAELEHRGLFVDALDDERGWFRYHLLFAQLLRQELGRVRPELVAPAHRRAAAWFGGHGSPEEAVEHTVAAEDWPGLRELMLGQVLALGTHRPPSVLEAWLAMVPRSMIGSPFFSLLHAFMWGQAGRTDDAREALDRALRTLEAEGAVPEFPEVGSLLLGVSASVARLDGDLSAARRFLDLTEDEIDRVGARDTRIGEMAAVVAANATAGVLVWHGHEREAELILGRVRRQAPAEQVRMHLTA